MSTLAILHSEIIAHVDRADITIGQIATFSKLARLELERLWLPKFLADSDSLSISGNAFIIPADSLGIINVWIHENSTTTKLARKDEAFVRRQLNTNKYYWREGKSAFLASSPAVSSTIRIRYIRSQADLTVATSSNKWFTGAYDVIFWATMKQTNLYLKDTEDAQIAQGIYTKLANDLELYEISENHSDLESAPGDF